MRQGISMQLIDNVTFNEKQQAQLKARFSIWAGLLTHPYVLLAIISIIAIFFRFYKLGEWSFWIDELFRRFEVCLEHGSRAAENIAKVVVESRFG